MISCHKSARFYVGAMGAFVLASVGNTGVSHATGTISKADLSGPWTITLAGNDGCGNTTLLATGTLDTTGAGTFTLQAHSSGCGNSTTTEKFLLQTLNANGSGTANLSCQNEGPCGWNFQIQVSPDRSVFNLVDISDPGNNLLLGTAIHQ